MPKARVPVSHSGVGKVSCITLDEVKEKGKEPASAEVMVAW